MAPGLYPWERDPGYSPPNPNPPDLYACFLLIIPSVHGTVTFFLLIPSVDQLCYRMGCFWSHPLDDRPLWRRVLDSTVWFLAFPFILVW